MKNILKIVVFLIFCNLAKAQPISIPDPNFKTILLNPGPYTAFDSSLTPIFIDTNHNGVIEQSEVLNIATLDVSNLNISDLTGIEYFSNLKILNISYNSISSINLTNLTILEKFDCTGNLIDNLNLSGLSNLSFLNCSGNMIPSINFTGLINLQSVSCSYNQLTSLDFSDNPLFWDLGCSNNNLQSINIKNGGWVETGIGNFSNDGWSNNPGLAYICCNDNDIIGVEYLLAFSYGVSNTININSYCSFTPGGVFYTIQGNNTFDENNNGCDALDSVYPNLKFDITDGTVSGGLISDTSGNYSIPVQAGTHTITPQFENPSYFTVSPTSVTVSFPSTLSPSIQNFCIAPNGVHHDLEVVVIPLSLARPGFDVVYKINYKNKGTINENAIINFNYDDSILDYVSSSIVPTSQVTGTLSWNIGTIAPFQSGEIIVTLNVNSPTEIPAVNAGDILSYTATINGLNTDETPSDNIFALNQNVVNSHDPNDKTCLEGEIINPTKIGDYVHYMIRFENTGIYPAQNIVVKDIIDTTKFDISTLQMTDASHSCVTKITNPDKVEFIFENINLPFASGSNDGYVVFKIKTKSTLVTGNTISNLANIYFDYNFPIITNTATSTFQTALANNDFYLDKNVSLSPIPAKDNLTISLQNSDKINSISIYNMLGQLVQTIIGSSTTINVSNLKTGDYILKINTENGTVNKKLIKE